jgi:hypothetical protein
VITSAKVETAVGASRHKTKGSHVMQARSWIDKQLGPGSFDALVDSIVPGEIDAKILLPGSWYSVGPLIKVFQEAARRLNSTVHDVTREIARQNAFNDLTTLYRVFLRIAAPVRVMSFTPRLWSNYVAFGEAVAIRNDPGYYIGECTGVPMEYLEWSCGAWCGFVPAAIEVAGGASARPRILGTWRESDGSRRLQCEVRYDLDH